MPGKDDRWVDYTGLAHEEVVLGGRRQADRVLVRPLALATLIRPHITHVPGYRWPWDWRSVAPRVSRNIVASVLGPRGFETSLPGEALGSMGLCTLMAGLLVLRHYGRRKTAFNPVVPTVLWWALSALGFGLWALARYIAPVNVPALLVMAGGWLLVAVVTPFAMRRLSGNLPKDGSDDMTEE